jgi:hypothetical protein
MSAELFDRNVIYDQTTDRGKASGEPIWLNAGPGCVLIVSVYDAAKVLAKKVAAEEIATEPVPGITLTWHPFNTDRTSEAPKQTSLRISTVVEAMRRSVSERPEPIRRVASGRSSISSTRPKTDRHKA